MNDLERQVMQFALRGEHPAMQSLRAQLAEAMVASRDYTGVGFITRFAVSSNAIPLASPRRAIIEDVYADVSGLRHSAGFLVFIERGMLDALEGFIVEDAWPTEAAIRRLYYVHPKEPGSASLIEVNQRDLAFAMREAEEAEAPPDHRS